MPTQTVLQTKSGGTGKLGTAAEIATARSVVFPEVIEVNIHNGQLVIKTDAPATVTVSFHRSRRQLLLGQSEATRAHLTLDDNEGNGSKAHVL